MWCVVTAITDRNSPLVVDGTVVRKDLEQRFFASIDNGAVCGAFEARDDDVDGFVWPPAIHVAAAGNARAAIGIQRTASCAYLECAVLVTPLSLLLVQTLEHSWRDAVRISSASLMGEYEWRIRMAGHNGPICGDGIEFDSLDPEKLVSQTTGSK